MGTTLLSGIYTMLLCGLLAVTGHHVQPEKVVATDCIEQSAIGDTGSIRERAALPTAALQGPRTGTRLGHSRPARVQPTHGKNPRRQIGGFFSGTYLPTGNTFCLGGQSAIRDRRHPWDFIYARFYYVIALERFLC